MRYDRLVSLLVMVTLSASGFLAWYLFFHKDGVVPSTGNLLEKFSSGGEEGAVNSASVIVALSKEPGISVTSSLQKGRILYYERDTGRVLEVGVDGKNEAVISGQKLPNFLRTVWSPTKREVISAFHSSQGPIFSLFNYDTRASVRFDPGVRSVAFSPDGKRLVSFRLGTSDHGVYLSYPDGGAPEKIFTTRSSQIEVAWPSASLIVITIHDEGTGLSHLFMLGTDGKLTRLLDSLAHLEATWSRDGTKLLYSFVDEEGTLQSEFLTVGDRAPRAVSVGLSASKCIWSIDNQTLICAVNPTQSDIPDTTGTGEYLYEIDIEKNTKKALMRGTRAQEGIVVGELMLTPSEDYLVFTNTRDGRVYGLKRF